MAIATNIMLAALVNIPLGLLSVSTLFIDSKLVVSALNKKTIVANPFDNSPTSSFEIFSKEIARPNRAADIATKLNTLTPLLKASKDS